MRQPVVLASLALCLLLAGCGQKGALYRDQARVADTAALAEVQVSVPGARVGASR
ncbi:LPS translocon maturation chaperone LptM [Marinobacter lutaoensis]|jgi:predicted small lipoprotein YifL|uniref:LPS translocon maturation chaperone LptM n=1 Tax=Marinobacter lutaoensis TaxID=135739 RepID=UPI001115944F|nr:lipoprotein [Marinobacter lutaoensis]